MSESEQSTKGPVVTPARLIAAVCVIVPFVAVLWVPIYDKDKPEVAGFPFFFWWQLMWVAVTAALMGLAYFVVRREEVARKAVPVAAASAPAAPPPRLLPSLKVPKNPATPLRKGTANDAPPERLHPDPERRYARHQQDRARCPHLLLPAGLGPRLPGRALAQGPPGQPSGGVGPGRPQLRWLDHLVPARRRPVHRLHVRRGPGRADRRRVRLLRRAVHDHRVAAGLPVPAAAVVGLAQARLRHAGRLRPRPVRLRGAGLAVGPAWWRRCRTSRCSWSASRRVWT